VCVSPTPNPKRTRRSRFPDPALPTVPKGTRRTVSHWRTWLKDEARYADRIMRGSFRAAGLIEPEARDYQMPIVPCARHSARRTRNEAGSERVRE
jgi:hypothetical protein